MAYEHEHFVDTSGSVWNYSLFTDEDVRLFQSGELQDGYKNFGSHRITVNGVAGFYFSVWAPNATKVSVIGDFNGWLTGSHSLIVRKDRSGIWEGFIPHLSQGQLYKYHIAGFDQLETFKADPFARFSELRPGTASVLWEFHKDWEDAAWMKNRGQHNSLQAPWQVYEMHLGSWMRPDPNNENSYNSYQQISERLIPYLTEMGFTHVEFMPVMEYPFDGSWGYQGTGYFSATSRFGEPEGLMDLIDQLHQNNIGVILDWVPSHFPGDDHGLYKFDGSHAYEYADSRKGFHPDWNSYIFNYARGEVRSFLLSSAHFWMEYFHADGLRVDAVNSIIRLDFSRKPGEWEPNRYGGNENIEAIEFLRHLNKSLYSRFEGIQTIAEEASDWPGITLAADQMGFGFGMKWMMGWMHDTFRYFKRLPDHRLHHQDDLTFSMMYFYNEKFMLPLSHDEVVHGKSPMIYKMPGNDFEKFANLRLLYAYMFTHPGAKLLFMGNEFGQTSEWDYRSELNWGLLQYDPHKKLQFFVAQLNKLCRAQPALYEKQFQPEGFEWIDLDHRYEGVLVFRRRGVDLENDVLVVINISSHNYSEHKFRIIGKSNWTEYLNSNDTRFGGNGLFLNDSIKTIPVEKNRKVNEIILDIPALSALILV